MGIFFKEQERKSEPWVNVIRMISIGVMITFLILYFVHDFDTFYMQRFFITVGISSIMNSIETYFQYRQYKRALPELGFALAFFILALTF
ncbi:hypothetical protein EQV77_06145 [Halobacillus fulvus]|nr:hypothetical protein EQV77_06145 [Halobacillus fulvus]